MRDKAIIERQSHRCETKPFLRDKAIVARDAAFCLCLFCFLAYLKPAFALCNEDSCRLLPLQVGSYLQFTGMFLGGFSVGFAYSWKLTLVIFSMVPLIGTKECKSRRDPPLSPRVFPRDLCRLFILRKALTVAAAFVGLGGAIMSKYVGDANSGGNSEDTAVCCLAHSSLG